MATDDHWSHIAADWVELWGSFADPARRALVAATHIGPGSRVLDVGCGGGEFIELIGDLGGIPAGIDPAAGMVELARSRVRGADIRVGSMEQLPWADADFDVVTAVNALQFAEDTFDALDELMRVTVPGGFIAIANWAERERNELDVIELAIAEASDEQIARDGELRMPGGLAAVMAEAGLVEVRDGLVQLDWEPADDDALVRGALLGEDAVIREELRSTIVDAARRFRLADGGYRLRNAFRFAVGRVPRAEPGIAP